MKTEADKRRFGETTKLKRTINGLRAMKGDMKNLFATMQCELNIFKEEVKCSKMAECFKIAGQF